MVTKSIFWPVPLSGTDELGGPATANELYSLTLHRRDGCVFLVFNQDLQPQFVIHNLLEIPLHFRIDHCQEGNVCSVLYLDSRGLFARDSQVDLPKPVKKIALYYTQPPI